MKLFLIIGLIAGALSGLLVWTWKVTHQEVEHPEVKETVAEPEEALFI